MKKPRHQNGPGNRAIDDFVDAMVARSGGNCFKEAAGIRVSLPNRADEFVAYVPGDHNAWITRLKWVEKHAAIFLLNAPVLYGMKWPGRTSRTSASKTLRLSVGLSLSVGPALSKRYTCVVKHGDLQARVFEGGTLEIAGAQESIVLALPAWAESDLATIADGVLKACECFEARPDVQKAILATGEKRRIELTQLDQLYRRKEGSNDQIFGLRPVGADGSSLIEHEMRRLQITVLDRYDLRIRVRYLSLGVIEGNIPARLCEAQ